MHNHLFEYAVIRVVPRVEREEFLNVGIIVFCKKENYIKTRVRLDTERLNALCPGADMEAVAQYLHAFQQIATGNPEAGPIAAMEVPERFRWLTAVRSSVLQTSRPHPGLCTDLDHRINCLFDELVCTDGPQ